MPRLALHWQILVALVLALLAGLATGPETRILGVQVVAAYAFVGELFLNALKMLIVPLVVSSLICGVAGLGSEQALGRLGGKTLGLYLVTTLLATLTGLFFVNLFEPGRVDGQAAGHLLNLSSTEQVAGELAKVQGRDGGDLVDVFLRIVPENIVGAAASDDMLGLIFFSLLFGLFMTRIEAERGRILRLFWQAVFDTMMAMTLWVMRFAPVGVFALVAKTVVSTGFSAFAPLLVFFVTVVAGLVLHALLTLPLLVRLVGLSPLRHYRAVAPALLTAFSTASSSATVPVTLECLEKNARVSNRTSSFVIPLGATVNMDGTALYECVAAVFIAQAYGLELSFAQQFIIVFTAVITSVGVAGIPAASLVAITVILGIIGLPLEGIGLLLVTDRLLDMMRTTVNVFSDTCCAVIVARTEGERQVLAP